LKFNLSFFPPQSNYALLFRFPTGVRESTSYVDPRATVHIMLGGAGNDEMDDAQAVNPNNKKKKSNQEEHPQEEGLTEEQKLAEEASAGAIAGAAEADAKLYAKKINDGSAWEAVTDFGYFGAGFVEVRCISV
jgi:hypothetical protein